MSRTIEVLPDLVANQIAAGEVVERPASVVRELVENALDARPTRVEIALQQGGKRRILVIDDGIGMGREDALTSLERHATSKIRVADDLRSVSTLGFRGEALPSIAAVSRMTLETRAEAEDVGTRIRIKSGTITGVEDFPRQRGTTVEVANLFFNAPARSKFLKATGAETRAVAEVVSVLAMANVGVGFTLTADSQVLLELPAVEDLHARIVEIWGPDDGRTLIPVALELGATRVRGLVQRPDATRKGPRRAYSFVNGRPFRSRHLRAAVDRGYRTTIPTNVRPWVFLFLDVPPNAVDMNVHPAKAEVRFRDAEAIEALVEKAIHECLASEASSASLDSGPPPLSVREPVRPPPVVSHAEVSQTALFLAGSGPDGAGQHGVEIDDESEWIPVVEEQPRLWQLLHTYVLAETREGLILIDQHSAHERILFERLTKAFEVGGQTGQRLLFPITVRLSKAELIEAEALTSILNAVGFEVGSFGGNTLIVHAVPDPHPYFDPERCIHDMMEELVRGSDLTRSAKNQHERIAMTFACKGSIKAGQRLEEREMQELFDQLFATELPYHDVHGRPTIVRLSKGELEKKFGR